MIILIAASNLIGNLIKVITEKRHELGILKTIGITDSQMQQIFITIGNIIAFLGVILGTFLAYVILKIQMVYKIVKIPLQGYPVDFLPVKMSFFDFIIFPIATFFIVVLATWYPSKKTLKISLVKLLRDK